VTQPFATELTQRAGVRDFDDADADGFAGLSTGIGAVTERAAACGRIASRELGAGASAGGALTRSTLPVLAVVTRGPTGTTGVGGMTVSTGTVVSTGAPVSRAV
jgi:hypothetical protein